MLRYHIHGQTRVVSLEPAGSVQSQHEIFAKLSYVQRQVSVDAHGHAAGRKSQILPFVCRTTRRPCPTGKACAAQTLGSLGHTRARTQPTHVRRCATASATTHSISNIRLAALSAVCPVGSSGGDTSQTSRIVKILELAFLLEVTPPTIAALHLVFRPPVTDTHRQYGR